VVRVTETCGAPGPPGCADPVAAAPAALARHRRPLLLACPEPVTRVMPAQNPSTESPCANRMPANRRTGRPVGEPFRLAGHREHGGVELEVGGERPERRLPRSTSPLSEDSTDQRRTGTASVTGVVPEVRTTVDRELISIRWDSARLVRREPSYLLTTGGPARAAG